MDNTETQRTKGTRRMVRSELVNKLRGFRGEIYADVQNHDDTYWIKVVKSDLIAQMTEKFAPNAETGFELSDDGFFSKDYSTK